MSLKYYLQPRLYYYYLIQGEIGHNPRWFAKNYVKMMTRMVDL